MATIKLYDDELADGRVPGRCLVCGREADFHSVNLFNGPMVLTVPLSWIYSMKRWGKPRADLGGGHRLHLGRGVVGCHGRPPYAALGAASPAPDGGLRTSSVRSSHGNGCRLAAVSQRHASIATRSP